MIIPTIGIAVMKAPTIAIIIAIIHKIITNTNKFTIPISFISENTCPKLNASPNESYLANLHCATVEKRANMI